METDILVAGECLVDFMPDQPGSLDRVERFERRAGGAPANVAVRLAELGPPPLFWTRLGDDPFGNSLERALERHGLPERFVRRDSEAKTTLAFVAHDEDADRAFTFYREHTADTRFETGVVPNDVLAELSWVAFGGVCLATEPSRSALLDLAERASQQECTVLFDPNARPELWDGDFPQLFREACTHAGVVTASPEDLAFAGIEGSPEELLAALLDLDAHTAVITLGEAGALARASDAAPWGPARAKHDGFDVEVVDTTGAGDAFTAGLIRALVDGEPLDDALAFANAVGAVTATSRGAMSASLDRDHVEGLI